MIGQTRRSFRLMAALLCALVLLTATVGVSAAADYYERSVVTPGSTAAPGSVILTKYNLYDSQPTPAIRPVDSGKTLQESVAELIANLEAGDIKAAKDGYFDTETDARDGIVKIVFDVVGLPPTEAVDVMVVLDESGSMTMYSTSENYQYTVPCLNPAHYYDVVYEYTDNAGQHHIGQHYDLYPSTYTNLNTWDDFGVPGYINEVKQKLADHLGLNSVTQLTMTEWGGQYDFGAHHYDENGVQIPKSGAHDAAHDGSNTGGYYSPPVGNASGCIDRQMIAKTALAEMMQKTNASNSASRFGLVTFAGKLASDTRSLSNALPIPGLSLFNGYDNTNYEVAMRKAYEELDPATNPKPAGRETVVLFVTDGMTNTGSADNAKRLANSIKGFPDTTLYCVGIKAGATANAILKEMASTGCYKDCDTMAAFETFLDGITSVISEKAAVMIDVLGDSYGLICDDAHPISIQEGSDPAVEYKTLNEAKVGGIEYNAATSQLEWSVSDATVHGTRLSFYVKLDDAVFRSTLPDGEGSFPTNNSAVINYTKVDPDDPGKPGEEKTIELPNPATIKIEQSKLTAVKSSDKPNRTVLPGDTITYTIAVQNTGKFDYTGVRVSDAIPAETEYVPGSGGTLIGGNVVFDIERVAAGGTQRVSFQVKVLAGVNRIVNYAMFGTSDVAASIVSGAPVCYANEVVNPRPGSGGAGYNPPTGDASMPYLWMGVIVLAGAVLIAVRKRWRA